jgi:hypothetical protein
MGRANKPKRSRGVCDQPFDDGGTGCGMTPPELTLSALGCGAVRYTAEYLLTRGLPVAGIEFTGFGRKGSCAAD